MHTTIPNFSPVGVLTRRGFLAAAAASFATLAVAPTRSATRHVPLVLGVAGGGKKVAQQLRAAGFAAHYQTLDREGTPGRAEMRSPIVLRMPAGASYTGTDAEEQVDEHLALRVADALPPLASGTKQVAILVGLGGLAGTTLAPLAAAHLSRHCRTVVVCSLPFAFEGERRMRNALRGLRQLESTAAQVVVHENEAVLASTRNGGTLRDLLRRIDMSMAEAAQRELASA